MNRRSFFLLPVVLFSCSHRLMPLHPLRIIVVGDSTVQTYPLDQPIRGWGQYIGARVMADLVAEGLKENVPELRKYLRR